ncbi:MAG TPA: hypothetical protein VFH18_07925 [Erysipelotrichaceae bacterium]|nr:hypothetical protein [Erysipelotrichaceae bacterium]
MKVWLKVFIGFIGILGLIVIVAIIVLMNGMEKGKAVEINQVNLEHVEDGTYTGSYDLTRWSNSVEVTVVNHRIEKIEVIEDVMIQLDELTQRLFNNVIMKQSLDVDIETGSTVTSLAYLKSIENALEGNK